MAIDRDPNMPSSGSTIPPAGSTIPPHGSTMYDHDDLNTAGTTNMAYDRETLDTGRRGGSSFWPFLLGGLVIALGLLGFLFYDGGGTSRDVSTTGSTTTQSAPATGSVTTPTPPAATAPAAPTTPAPRQ